MDTISSERAETTEAEFMYRTESAAPEPDRRVLGLSTRRMAGGVALAAPHDRSEYWSKALGFGFAEPITGDLLDSVIKVWEEAGNSTGVLQLAPSVLPDDWETLRLSRSLEESGHWVKLAARVEDIGPAATDLRIGAVEPKDAYEWAQLVLNTFGMQLDGLAGMMAASVLQEGLHAYAAWDGERMVSAAMLNVNGDCASMHAAATLPEYRNRGAQSALISARAAGARDHGCRWIMAETAHLPADVPNPSLANLQRAGLIPLYLRPNFTWHKP